MDDKFILIKIKIFSWINSLIMVDYSACLVKIRDGSSLFGGKLPWLGRKYQRQNTHRWLIISLDDETMYSLTVLGVLAWNLTLNQLLDVIRLIQNK